MTYQTLGSGEVYFSRFLTDTETPEGFRYIGNTSAFNISTASETLEHYDSDHGIRTLDDVVPTQTTRSGSLTTDEISPDNLALLFLGSAAVVSQSAVTVVDEAIGTVLQGLSYQLGVSANNPAGVRNLGLNSTGPNVNVVVKVASATKTEGTDYTVDMLQGTITIIKGGAIADNAAVTVSYKTLASTRNQVVSGNKAIFGAIKFKSFNAKGAKLDYDLPKVVLSPNGDFALKGDTWQEIAFNLNILKKSGQEAVYVNGRPLT